MAVKASPLLKFDKDEKGFLAPDGVARIKELPPSSVICPVIFIGDGRGGKSYLASRLAGGEDAFESSDAAEPVTEGIDIVIVPVPPILEECGADSPVGHPKGEEFLMILDCEGGNNAMAAIRTLVNVFGIMIGTQVVFVASGQASESALQDLSASLAATSLIKLDGHTLPDRRLVFVVNKNTLQYKDDALENMLTLKDNMNPGRAEIRESIRDSFSDRAFCAIPLMGMPNFEPSVAGLRKAIVDGRKPLIMDGAPVSAPTLTGLLELIVKEIRNTNEVSFPSMHRYVILNGFLIPTAERLVATYDESLPKLTDWHDDLEDKNPKPTILKEFDDIVSYIAQKALICEARDFLVEKIDHSWLEVVRCNSAFGDQVKGDILTETREVAAETQLGPIGGRGLLRRVNVTMQKMRVESRAVIHRKRGGDPELGPWMDSNSTTTRILESAFEIYGTLPIIRGRLQKNSPNMFRKVMKVAGMHAQERACILKDGHFLWWEPDTMAGKGEAAGCINFLINRAAVSTDPSYPGYFCIKPSQASGWSDSSLFSGGEQRQFWFDTSDCEVKVEEWVGGIQQHISFADKVSEQLGEEKIMDEVGMYKPTLVQVDV